MNDCVQVWVVPGQLGCKAADRISVFDVQDRGLHSWIRGDGFFKQLLAPAGDDHLVAERMKGLRECPPDARTPACDQNRISIHLHVVLSLL
jgi:hypothetical protein